MKTWVGVWSTPSGVGLLLHWLGSSVSVPPSPDPKSVLEDFRVRSREERYDIGAKGSSFEDQETGEDTRVGNLAW